MKTRIDIRIEECEKVRFEARCKELGLSLSDWLRYLANSACDMVVCTELKEASKVVCTKKVSAVKGSLSFAEERKRKMIEEYIKKNEVK